MTMVAIYEYCLVRYVPDIEREEFINVGLIMMSKRQRWLRSRIELNRSRVAALTGRSSGNVEAVERQLGMFERIDVPQGDLPVEERYRWMAAVKSAVIQVSASHPGIIPIADDCQKEDACDALDEKFDELFERLVKG